jgi:hypothetical protein
VIINQFLGMSDTERRAMPHRGVPTNLAPRGDIGRARIIARDQCDYVSDVYHRCPAWRFRKKRKLRTALHYADSVHRLLLLPR